MENEIARYKAVIWKVQTLSGGGFRCTYDGISQDIAQAAYQMPFADTPGVLVEVIIRRIDGEDDGELPAKRTNMHI